MLEKPTFFVYYKGGGKMPRSARVTFENGCYHIITRGNQKQKVFLESQDYRKYIKTLSKYKQRYKFKLYAFCLMPNHVHMIMEIAQALDLIKTMHGLNLSYTLYFNTKYDKVGHLWQDRYKSKILYKDTYLLECVSYIENNPVRANIVANIDDYLWSSYKLRKDNNPLVDSVFTL